MKGMMTKKFSRSRKSWDTKDHSTQRIRSTKDQSTTYSSNGRLIAQDNPVTCAVYAKEKGLLDLPGWKCFKKLAKKNKKLVRALNQSKLKQFGCAPKFKFGFGVPRD